MARRTFKSDLAIAQVTEAAVAQLLMKHFEGSFNYEFGKNSDWDIKFDRLIGGPLTFETKEDFYCKKSGNVALEFHSRGKDSGIAVSKADYYVYKLHRPDDTIVHILIPIADLKQAVADKKYFRVVNGGDRGSDTYCYLFSLEVFLALGTFLD